MVWTWFIEAQFCSSQSLKCNPPVTFGVGEAHSSQFIRFLSKVLSYLRGVTTKQHFVNKSFFSLIVNKFLKKTLKPTMNWSFQQRVWETFEKLSSMLMTFQLLTVQLSLLSGMLEIIYNLRTVSAPISMPFIFYSSSDIGNFTLWAPGLFSQRFQFISAELTQLEDPLKNIPQILFFLRVETAPPPSVALCDRLVRQCQEPILDWANG